ncbi:lantibiotic dehydratase [Phytohabitans aurantiacus]|uniref:Lantibiotic dehydratase n=1 Tax=Phytohabitans aurantiacus TaxID=3016789 RepID=A0ABQ5R5V1_9ACTN|nr:lantibiotic dehydratase [Phytohabitans aurantiacus]GLI00936.1 hypothetical protein Pa4123_62120 [Phytohabitans aurantiacus]
MPLPPWPDLTGESTAHVEEWRAWLRSIWAVDAVVEAVEHASPALADEVAAVCGGRRRSARQIRRTVFALTRYLLRMMGRATPFGLFAGVAPASFDSKLVVRWGDRHHAVASADGSWLSDVVARLEACPELLERLSLSANDTAFVRGDRLVVPFQPEVRTDDRVVAVDVSIRNTAAVRLVVEAATAPIRGEVLAAKLAADFPTTPRTRIRDLLADLVSRCALITSLHAPSTVADAFGHLLEQLDAVRASEISQLADLVDRLREIRAALLQHNQAGSQRRDIGTAATNQMRAVTATARQPLAVDLHLDCTLVLPWQVMREAAIAASALVRLTAYPSGPIAWQSYHNRFFERYGIGALVPVLDVVDPDVGLGFPDGYQGAGPEPARSIDDRDARLLTLAQSAALDGCDEIVLDERLLAELSHQRLERARLQPHAELCFQVHARSQAAIACGEFELAVVSVSRGVGTMSGRFVELLGQERFTATFARLPTGNPDALSVQVSIPPFLARAGHVARAPQFLPAGISVAEQRGSGDGVIRLEDIVVGCDSERLYLASLAHGRLLEPTMLHALDLRVHASPLARFLVEVGRAQAAVFAGFDWGAAAHLPVLPRLRYRRTILAPARWLLDQAEFGGRHAPWARWQEALAGWRARRRLPDHVYLTEADQRLPLDLSEPSHTALLRDHLERSGRAVLTEAPGREAFGWFGGRAHEVVVPLTATRTAHQPAPLVSPARLFGRDHGHLPGASRWLYAKLYGHPERQPEILASQLPTLLSEWGEPPLWWYIRYRDPHPHLRLRILLADANEFGPAAGRVSVWAGRLRRLGLLGDVQFTAYYPEMGRWGSGPLMVAAEAVFSADSRALVTEFSQPSRSARQALTAAHFVAISTAFHGGTSAGMDWLIRYARTDTTAAPARTVLDEAVRLADPTDDWAHLRAAPGGHAISAAWEPRRHALAAYRALLDANDGISQDIVLDSLLHAHHIRAVGIDRDDERTCLRLARSAALAWNARSGRTGT